MNLTVSQITVHFSRKIKLIISVELYNFVEVLLISKETPLMTVYSRAKYAIPHNAIPVNFSEIR